MSIIENSSSLPDIWLRAFYGFNPEEDGYIGWTDEARRDRMINELSPNALMLIYGAENSETATQQRRQALGFLQVDLIPIRDRDKSSEKGLHEKATKGWKDRWTYALPVRRAWRIDRRIEIRHIAKETYTPDRGRAIASWSAKLTAEEASLALSLPVTEVSVYGEHPPEPSALRDAPLLRIFAPSRGVEPKFGTKSVTTSDGAHFLYMLKYSGHAAHLLGLNDWEAGKRVVVKVGYSSDPVRRRDELNVGIPPAAKGRWNLWLKSSEYESGEDAKSAEDALKAEFNKLFQSLGGEFFLGEENLLQSQFAVAPSAARFRISV